MNIGLVTDRVNSMVAQSGFRLSSDPWDFEYAPSQGADRLYRIETSRIGGGGYIGGGGEELHSLQIWLARKVKRDPHGAVRQLKTDMVLLESALLDEPESFFYCDGDSVRAECRIPLSDSDYVVGQLTATVSFERE